MLVRDARATLAAESEECLRRRLAELKAKLADTGRVSAQVEESFKQSETEVARLQEHVKAAEQLSRRRLIEELAKLQVCVRACVRVCVCVSMAVYLWLCVRARVCAVFASRSCGVADVAASGG